MTDEPTPEQLDRVGHLLRGAAGGLECEDEQTLRAWIAIIAGELARRWGGLQACEDLRDLADLLERGAIRRAKRSPGNPKGGADA